MINYLKHEVRKKHDNIRFHDHLYNMGIGSRWAKHES